MEDKTCYIFSILKTLGIAALGLIIASAVGGDFGPFMGSWFLAGVLFAGLPFGWVAITKIFGSWVSMNIWLLIFFFLLKLFGAFVIGWAIMLYRLVRDVICLVLAIRTENACSENDVSATE